MGTVAETLNKYLKVFNQIDEVYLKLVSDPSGVPNPTVDKPTDFNIGTIADLLEWNRQLTISLKKQIFLNQASGDFLDYFCRTMFDIYRFQGETDSQFITRVQNYVLSHRLSPASIIDACSPYSSLLPEIIEGQMDAAFADVTFSDCYSSWQCANPVGNIWHDLWIFPAIPTGADTGAFYFILVMYDLDPANVQMVIDIVDNWKAAGVGYDIEIRYTP